MSPVDPRLHSPAAERNAPPILAVLRERLPEHGLMLEIASGSGQHAAYLASALPGWRWQPTDADAVALASIAGWAASAGANNLLAPVLVDVLADDWRVPRDCDAVFCANLLHIASAAATPALMRGAARHLRPAAPLLVYGPFWIDGQTPAPSNLAFDAALRGQDPSWGIRALSEVVLEARRSALELTERVDMPANNQLLVFTSERRSAAEV